MAAFLLLVGLAALLTKYSPRFNRLEQRVRDVAGQHSLFFIVNAAVSVSLFLLALVFSTLGRLFEWNGVSKFGDDCYGLGVLSCLGFAALLKWKSESDEAEEQRRIKEALLKPRTEINVGRNFNGNMAVDNNGPVWQSARVEVQALHEQILSLKEQVAKSSELGESQRQAAMENLTVVDEQLGRPAAGREHSKIERALKLLPGILSTVSAFAKAWETLEPAIKPHLQ